jgi:hypothetical protein
LVKTVHSSIKSKKLGDENTATIVMEALREQALNWALLLQDEKPESAASWKLLQPLSLEHFDKVVNETQKFKLIATLQQRQNKSSKDFLDCCKTAWYGLLRKLRTKYKEQIEKDAHDDTHNECIKCMFICGMRNDVRMAVESIAGNRDTLETTLAAAVHYKSALNIGGGKQGGAQRYGQMAALEITGSENAAASSSSSNGSAGMQEMKMELAAIMSALAAIGVQVKGGKREATKGRFTKGAKKAASGQHGRRGRRRTLNGGCAGSASCMGMDKVLQLPIMGPAHCSRVQEDTSGMRQAHTGSKVATVWGNERLAV